MAAPRTKSAGRRQRGEIEALPSGSMRVKVYTKCVYGERDSINTRIQNFYEL
ncbi:MAG: hypothetical protein QOD96_5678 [Pseudonocardiales bacterium]|nr:hypothetical protein [Pseudonocardiales bacterium]